METAMATLTLNIPTPDVVHTQEVKSTGPGFWRRVFDAMIEARTQRAELELAQHRRFLARDFGFEPQARDEKKGFGALPFVR
jgi:hypothetical protein